MLTSSKLKTWLIGWTALTFLYAGPVGATELESNVRLFDLSGQRGEALRYFLVVPDSPLVSSIGFVLVDGVGDAVLYVRRGAPPTLEEYDFGGDIGSPASAGGAAVTGGDTWYFMIYGQEDFSGAEFEAGYTLEEGCGFDCFVIETHLQKGVPTSELSGEELEDLRYLIEVPAGARNLEFRLSGGTGDADLAILHDGRPSLWDYDCLSEGGDNEETCSIASPAAGPWYVLVHGFEAFSGATLVADFDGVSAGCVPDEETLCLEDRRFRVELDWRDRRGNTGSAKVVPLGPFAADDSGLFWFFSPDNWEMLVKVIDGCRANNHFWVFSAATTNVEYTLRVTDTETGRVEEYFNPLGNAAAATTDTGAFATCP